MSCDPGQIRNAAVAWLVQTRLPLQSFASGSVTTHPVQLSSLASVQPGKPELWIALVDGPALVPPSPCSLHGIGVPAVTGVQPGTVVEPFTMATPLNWFVVHDGLP